MRVERESLTANPYWTTVAGSCMPTVDSAADMVRSPTDRQPRWPPALASAAPLTVCRAQGAGG